VAVDEADDDSVDRADGQPNTHAGTRPERMGDRRFTDKLVASL
jgi:hypothetical protein